MKPIFCTDVTNDKHSEAIHGEEFVISTISEDVRREINTAMREAAAPMKKAELPLIWQILRFTGLCLAFAAVISLLGNGFHVLPLLWGIGGYALYLGIARYGKKRRLAFFEGPEADAMANAMEAATRRVMEELEIPENALTADVICFRYKEKDGKRVVVPAMNAALYVNVDVFCYNNETHLFLADMERVYAFPLAGMKAITPVREPITLSRWNKKEPASYYNLTVTNRGVPTNLHYVLEFTADGQDYGIYFPVYELEAVKRLTGLTEGE